MKIQIDITKQIVRGLIGGANFFYWADGNKATWNERAMVLSFEDTEDDGKKYRLTSKDFARGLAVMAKECPNQLAAILSEDDDMYTGDALIQCAAFGELKYV